MAAKPRKHVCRKGAPSENKTVGRQGRSRRDWVAGDRGQEIRKLIPAPSKGCYKPVLAAIEFKPPNAIFNFLVATFQTRKEKPS